MCGLIACPVSVCTSVTRGAGREGGGTLASGPLTACSSLNMWPPLKQHLSIYRIHRIASRRRRWRVTTLIRKPLDQRHASAGRRRGGGPSGRRLSAAREIGRALAALAAAGKARMVPRPETGGRPAEIWVATGA